MTDPILATAVVLWRDGAEGREVCLVRRGDDRRFAGGFHAFPGGRVDPADAALPVPGHAPAQALLVACAARELFEETGVLLARGAGRLDRRAREDARRALLEERTTFAELLAAHGLSVDAGALLPAARWVTPDHLPLRYDAHMFVARLPQGEAAEIWPGELAGGGFVAAAEALRRWDLGEVLLHPPNLWAVTVLARPGELDLDALRDPPHRDGPISRRIEFQRGIRLAALRTPTLPPATHTNAWLLDVDGGLAVVDPGAPGAAEQAVLDRILDELAADGLPAREIWLTHGHPDHAGGVAALAARRGLPVLAHPRASERAGVPPVRALREGDLLAGRWRVLETPGHAPDHLAFHDERTGALVCGDMVSTLSTILIDPPEGDMAEYERQLERLEALAPRTLYPGHGPPAPGAPARLAAYRQHRREREARVITALEEGGTLSAIAARAYQDTPGAYPPVAERSCLAILEKLASNGIARRDGGGWQRAS